MTTSEIERTINNSRAIRVILIGCGKAGQYHATCLASMPTVQIVGVMNSGRADPVAFREEFGIQTWIRNESELMSLASTADAILICVTNDQAEAVYSTAANTGLPILIEKPFGTSLEQSLRMQALQEKDSAPTIVGFNRRCYSALLKLEDLFALRGVPTRIHIDAPEPIVRLMLRGRAPVHHERRTLLNTTHALDVFTRYFGSHESIELASAKRTRSGVIFDTMAFVHYPEDRVGIFTSHAASPGPWTASMHGDGYKVEVNFTANRAHVFPGGKASYNVEPSDLDRQFKPGVWIQNALFLLQCVMNVPPSGMLCTVDQATESNRLAEALM